MCESSVSFGRDLLLSRLGYLLERHTDRKMTIIPSPPVANYIIKFKKDASSSDIEKFYEDISKQGEPTIFTIASPWEMLLCRSLMLHPVTVAVI